MELDFFTKILTSAILGGLIGLERDIAYKKGGEQFAGLRSYALIAILGVIGTYLDSLYKTKFIFSVSLLTILTVFIISAYIYASFKKGEIGITSELTAILTFFIGIFVGFDLLKISIIFAISIIIIISLKDKFDEYKASISKEEFMHTLKFAVVAFVILPLLPDMKFSINNLLSFTGISDGFKHPILEMAFFNPYSVWFFVVVMSAVGYVGYILSKILGKNSSVVVSSVIGGLVSSTAVTATMSEQSKKDTKNPYIYVIGVLAANSVMLIRVIAIVLVLNISLIQDLWLPAFLMLAGFIIVIFYSFHKSKEATLNTHVKVEEKIKSPFSIVPALKFGLFILFIKFIAGIGLVYKDFFIGDLFYYIFGIISGFADVDAITQTMATQSREGLLIGKLAISTILLAVMSNNVVKSSMAYKFGGKEFGKIVIGAFGLSIILGMIGIFVF